MGQQYRQSMGFCILSAFQVFSVQRSMDQYEAELLILNTEL